MAGALALSYGDAVKILTGESAMVQQLDAVLGLGLLAAAPIAPDVVLSLFDAKAELVKTLNTVLARVKDRLDNGPITQHATVLTAAHAVLVMTSFTEELARRLTQIDAKGGWSNEIKTWAGQRQRSEHARGSRSRRIIDWSRQITIESPGPTRSFEDVCDEVRNLYQSLADQAKAYIQGLARWDEVSETRREEITAELSRFLPQAALDRFRVNYLRLAGDVPAFLAWILITDLTVTRNLVRQQQMLSSEESCRLANRINELASATREQEHALGHLSSIVEAIEPSHLRASQTPDRILAAHNRLQTMVLSKPVLRPGIADDLPGLSFPTTGEGYINPQFRIADAGTQSASILFAQESWWSEQPLRGDLAAHLVSYLMTPRATVKPLLILGHPGAGKSVLSRVIAAQLPATRYVTVRVELRSVDSSASIVEQIDRSLRINSNGTYGWRELSDETDNLIRVVVLDGLDELLQLSGQDGLGRYLERVERFQETEAELSRPTAVIVTARTLVMDRVYVPVNTVAINLEAFDEEQLNQWLGIWNTTNQHYFSMHGLHSLTADTLRRHRDLASQPLLLLMLALYDADGNALRREPHLTKVDLYEKLLRRFVTRELAKDSRNTEQAERYEQMKEERLTELSAIAVGMLNRGRKFISRAEVEADLDQLDLRRVSATAPNSQVPADVVASQFFFLYRYEVRADDAIIRHGYEFLHATFGEFFVARELAAALARIATATRLPMAWGAGALADTVATHLRPYLAFRPLVGERQIVLFLIEMVERSNLDRAAVTEALSATLRTAYRDGLPNSIYRPRNLGAIATAAVWSLNLVLMMCTVSRGEALLGETALGNSPTRAWSQLTALWKSQLDPDDWDTTIQSLEARVAESGVSIRHVANDAPRNARAADREIFRLRAEARLSGNVPLRSAALVWDAVRPTGGCLGDPPFQSDVGQMTLARAIAIALGGDEAADAPFSEIIDGLVNELDIRWYRPLTAAGTAAWTDAVLIAVLEHTIALASPGDQSPEGLSTRLVASLLRELIGRGYPDLAERLLRSVHSLQAGHHDVVDLAMLAEISRAYRMPHLRLAILGAIPSDWGHNELTMLINSETAQWLIAALLETLPNDFLAKHGAAATREALSVESAGRLWRSYASPPESQDNPN
ncbi:ATP-binding protein [Solwaraspora sp. WMMA2065]|uniref:NACHT domain-containing protein n=1 Tax=Solwaraspora sp. WMMA2065 TaxID=3015166 RepID=UPI00259B00BC|nr:ATP-binding protein [Solwaraspora sp. WMMA2065]WJK34222.1 ATP-binding protein [Solwaraspora sp. WMMA2065]